MMGWLVIAVGAIAMFAFLAANAALGISSVGEAQGRMETIRRLDAARAAIERDAMDAGPEMLMPAGVQGGSLEGYRVPPRLGLTALSPFGGHFVYCPFGPVRGGSLTITNPNGTTYDVGVENGRIVSGRPNYARVQIDGDLLGYLIAPSTRNARAASCDQVSFDVTSQQFLAPNSIVRPLRRLRGEVQLRDAAAREIVIYVGPDGSPDVLGVDRDNPTTVARAMSELASRRPETATVYFLPGSYSVPASTFATAATSDLTRGFTGRVTLTGLGPVAPSISLLASGEMRPYSDVLIRNLDFGANMRLTLDYQRRAQIVGSRLGALQVNGGSVQLQGATLTGISGIPTIAVGGGEVATSGANRIGISGTDTGVFLSRGAQFRVNGGTLSLLPSGIAGGASFALVTVRPGARFSAEGALIFFGKSSVNGFLLSGGTARISGSTIQASVALTNGLALDNLASLQLDNSLVMATGTRPSGSTVFDGGAILVAGQRSRIGVGARCWDGPVFATAATGTAGSLSMVTADVAVPALAAAPSNADVVQHFTLLQDNARRRLGRMVNQSSWSCE